MTDHPRRLGVTMLAFLAMGAPSLARAQSSPARAELLRQAQAAITHVIFIVQENRSFDTYFGTYPGADGLNLRTCIPLDPGTPDKAASSRFTTCLMSTAAAHMLRPTHRPTWLTA